MLKELTKSAAYRLAPHWAPRLDERWWLCKQARLLRATALAGAPLDEMVELVLGSPWFRSLQKKSEILALLHLLRQKPPLRFCEIGAAGGGTLFLFSLVAAPHARILSIDPAFCATRKAAYARFIHPRQRLTCLAADSHQPTTWATVHRWLAGAQLDFLFIDGDHSLEGVQSDYDMYAPLARPGGWIAFHDIVPDYGRRFGIPTSSKTGGVPDFWSSLKARMPGCRDIVEDPNQDGYGIGIVPWRM